jgi:hypothetical protein
MSYSMLLIPFFVYILSIALPWFSWEWWISVVLGQNVLVSILFSHIEEILIKNQIVKRCMFYAIIIISYLKNIRNI